MKTKHKLFGVVGIIGIIAVVIILAVVAVYVGLQRGEIVSSTNFAHPIWGRIQCQPTDAWEGNRAVAISEAESGSANGKMITCGSPENTDECRVYMPIIPSASWYATKNMHVDYKKCSGFSSSTCSGAWVSKDMPSKGSEWFITSDTILREGEGLEVRCWQRTYIGLRDYIACNLNVNYRPWKLTTYEEGAKYISNSKNCCFGSSDTVTTDLGNILAKKAIPSGETISSCLPKSGSTWVNYITKFAYGPAVNVYTHLTYGQVYCTNKNIYKIASVTMKDESMVKIDPATSKQGAPSYFNTIGASVGTVECCPQEPNCGMDFKYKPVPPPDKPCVSDAQCYNGGNPTPTSLTQYKVEKCQSGKCTWTGPFTVECTSNAACSGGKICDLSISNYGKCVQGGGIQICGDGICNGNEDKNNCPNDCSQSNDCKATCDTTYSTGLLSSINKQFCYLQCELVALFQSVVAIVIAVAIGLVILGGILITIGIVIVKVTNKKTNKK